VQPSDLVIHFEKSNHRGVGQLVVSGEAVKGASDAIESIHCPHYRVEWKAKHKWAGASIAEVDLTLIHESGQKWFKESSLEIKAKGISPAIIPVHVKTPE
jgi:hypothetical protein